MIDGDNLESSTWLYWGSRLWQNVDDIADVGIEGMACWWWWWRLLRSWYVKDDGFDNEAIDNTRNADAESAGLDNADEFIILDYIPININIIMCW